MPSRLPPCSRLDCAELRLPKRTGESLGEAFASAGSRLREGVLLRRVRFVRSIHVPAAHLVMHVPTVGAEERQHNTHGGRPSVGSLLHVVHLLLRDLRAPGILTARRIKNEPITRSIHHGLALVRRWRKIRRARRSGAGRLRLLLRLDAGEQRLDGVLLGSIDIVHHGRHLEHVAGGSGCDVTDHVQCT